MRRLLAFGLLLLAPLKLAAQGDWEAGLFTAARQLPLVSQSQLVRIAGGEAVLELVQVFANEGELVAQADYRLHLPTGAVVSTFGFWRGDRFLAAELKEKEEARQAHSAAAASGRASALLQREGSMHSFSVFPVAAGALQQIETSIRLPVVTERGRSHLRLPMDSFLGHATVTSTAIVHIESDGPLRAFGIDGVRYKTLGQGDRWVKLGFSANRPVDVWWAEEAPPLLTRVEAVPLEDGVLGVQIRVLLNDAGDWSPSYGELVLLVDTSLSMRRRSHTLVDLLDRVIEQSPAPVRIQSVAQTTLELDGSDREQLLRDLFSGNAGHRTEWGDLVAAATLVGCSDPQRRCVAVTDPQLGGLTAERDGRFETFFLADANELAYFAEQLGPSAPTYQAEAEPRAKLHALLDELVLPALAVVALDQPGGTLEVHGSPRLRIAEGGLLRFFATSRSEEPIELVLEIGSKRLPRRVVVDRPSPESRLGRAVRRGVYSTVLGDWMGEFRRNRDPELRRQIVDLSLREGIPTALTSLHVAAAEGDRHLPRTATAGPLARRVGWILVLLSGVVWWAGRRFSPTALRGGLVAEARGETRAGRKTP